MRSTNGVTDGGRVQMLFLAAQM